MVVGPLIAAGASLAGALLSRSSAQDAASQQMAIAQQNIALQKQFAQEGIQWKVKDALKAGIHPLFALGAQTSSFSPVSVGSSADTSLGEGLSQAGQHLGRAVAASADNEARALTLKGAALDVEKKGLENDILRMEIASNLRRTLAPGTVAAPGGVKPEKDFTSATMFGVKMNPSKSFSDVGGPLQQRYGEPIEWVMFPPTILADMWKTAKTAGTDESRAAAQAKFNRYMDFMSSQLR